MKVPLEHIPVWNSIYLTYNSGKEYKDYKGLNLDIFHLNLGRMNELESLYNNNNKNNNHSSFFLLRLKRVWCLY